MMATIENLPKELLVEIFSHYVRSEGHEKFLRNIPRVCKAWSRLTTEAPIWKDITVEDPEFLQHLTRRGFLRHTQSLKIDDDESFSDVNLSPVLKSIRDLKALDLKLNILRRNTVNPVTENCPHLERLHLEIPVFATSHELDQLLTVCGPTLKHLYLSHQCSREEGQQLVSGIAAKCPLLETLWFSSHYAKTPFPIQELRFGCPRLRVLHFYRCQLITTEGKDPSLDCGFKELKEFTANISDFSGFDIYMLLKDSVDFEDLQLCNNNNMVFCNVSKIPSDKVRILRIELNDPDENLEALEDAVFKWRRTLSFFRFNDWKCDYSSIIERFLQDNPNPPLKYLAVGKNINLRLFRKFVLKCQDLIHLRIGSRIYNSRDQIEEAVGIPCERKRKLCLKT